MLTNDKNGWLIFASFNRLWLYISISGWLQAVATASNRKQQRPNFPVYLFPSFFNSHDISSSCFWMNNWLDKHIFPAWMHHALMVEFLETRCPFLVKVGIIIVWSWNQESFFFSVPLPGNHKWSRSSTVAFFLFYIFENSIWRFKKSGTKLWDVDNIELYNIVKFQFKSVYLIWKNNKSNKTFKFSNCVYVHCTEIHPSCHFFSD